MTSKNRYRTINKPDPWNNGAVVKVKVKENRNRRQNRFGRIYENRKGKWTSMDKAEEEFGRSLAKAVTLERVTAELNIMNYAGKRGPHYRVAPSVIQYLIRMKEAMKKSYRIIAGFIKGELEPLGIFCPTYSTAKKLSEVYVLKPEIKRMMERADEEAGRIFKDLFENSGIGIPSDSENSGLMTVWTAVPGRTEDKKRNTAVDSSGETLEASGAWIGNKWDRTSRRFIKQHTLIDIDTLEPLSVVFTTKEVGDATVCVSLLQGAMDAGYRIQRTYADAAYDSNDIWIYCDEHKIEFIPNLKSNAKKNKKSSERDAQITVRETFGNTQWAAMSGYGRRWLVEVFFSSSKHVFGEKIASRQFGCIVTEMVAKYQLYSERREIILKYLRVN